MGGDLKWSPPDYFFMEDFEMVYKRKGKQERGSTHIVLTRISEEEYDEINSSILFFSFLEFFELVFVFVSAWLS